jgi:GT2 family glycosyltransferase
MSAAGAVDLSVIIVNYNVAPLVLRAVASLEGQKFAGQDGGDGRLEIQVIDNASSPQDVACLERLPSSVTLVMNDRNVGFAAANNQGIERASGQYLCFLNPDTTVLDGALESLLGYLFRHPEIGAVGPKIWGDDERTILIPPGDPPTLSFLLSAQLAGAVRTVAERHTRSWHRRAVAFWRRRAACSVPMLSGACIVAPRAVVEQVGGFDTRYFLYYEDADWCRRVCRAGYRLAYVPDANIVHYYNQSAKQDPQGAWGHALRSQARFIEAHYGSMGVLLYKAAGAISGSSSRWWAPAAPQQVIDLGRPERPPLFTATGAAPSRELVLQIGYDWRFVPSVAAFVREADFELSPAVWDRMQPGRYYARLIDPETLRPLTLWSWEKA